MYKHYIPIKCHVIHGKFSSERTENIGTCKYTLCIVICSLDFVAIFIITILGVCRTKSAFVDRHTFEFFLSFQSSVLFSGYLHC